MDFAFYFCSSQILIICGLLCIFARGFLWRIYARDTERPQPRQWTTITVGLGALFIVGSFLSVWMLATIVNQG
jgi:heme/copper-type cytochrome/quinol oxidase subunit 3